MLHMLCCICAEPCSNDQEDTSSGHPHHLIRVTLSGTEQPDPGQRRQSSVGGKASQAVAELLRGPGSPLEHAHRLLWLCRTPSVAHTHARSGTKCLLRSKASADY